MSVGRREADVPPVKNPRGISAINRHSTYTLTTGYDQPQCRFFPSYLRPARSMPMKTEVSVDADALADGYPTFGASNGSNSLFRFYSTGDHTDGSDEHHQTDGDSPPSHQRPATKQFVLKLYICDLSPTLFRHLALARVFIARR